MTMLAPCDSLRVLRWSHDACHFPGLATRACSEIGMLSVPASRLRSELEALGTVSVHASVDTEAVHFAPDDKQIIQVRLSQALPALPSSGPPAQAKLQQLTRLSCACMPLPTLVRLKCWMHGKAALICACRCRC